MSEIQSSESVAQVKGDQKIFQEILDNAAEYSLNFPLKDGSMSPTKEDSFSKELNRLQEQQITYTRKIEKEKRRKEQLEHALQESNTNLRVIQEQTHNGNIARDSDIKHKKKLGRTEHQLQTAKMKLSLSKNENLTLKKKIHDLRLEKVLSLNILNELYAESAELKQKTKQSQKEILFVNDRKHKIKLSIVNTKHKMVRDIEEFSKELNLAKQSISNTQQNILGTIRDRINSAYNNPMASTLNGERVRNQNNDDYDTDNKQNDALTKKQAEIESLLKETPFPSVVELLTALQQSEDEVFVLYNETQLRNQELEKIELTNRHLEQQVESQ
eukprot:gene7263-9901_t